MVFRSCGIHRQPTTFTLLLFFLVIGGQVRGNHFPGQSFIGGFMHKLTSKIYGAVIKRILANGGIPVKPEHGISIGRGRAYSAVVPGFPVITSYITLLAHSITKLTIVPIRNHIESIAKGDFLPVTVSNSLCFPHIRWSSPRTIVLHSPVHIIWIFVVGTNMIKLCHR